MQLLRSLSIAAAVAPALLLTPPLASAQDKPVQLKLGAAIAAATDVRGAPRSAAEAAEDSRIVATATVAKVFIMMSDAWARD